MTKGRPDKPHVVVSIKLDSNIHERMENYREEVNKHRYKKMTKTELVERALTYFLNYKEEEEKEQANLKADVTIVRRKIFKSEDFQ